MPDLPPLLRCTWRLRRLSNHYYWPRLYEVAACYVYELLSCINRLV